MKHQAQILPFPSKGEFNIFHSLCQCEECLQPILWQARYMHRREIGHEYTIDIVADTMQEAIKMGKKLKAKGFVFVGVTGL